MNLTDTSMYCMVGSDQVSFTFQKSLGLLHEGQTAGETGSLGTSRKAVAVWDRGGNAGRAWLREKQRTR